MKIKIALTLVCMMLMVVVCTVCQRTLAGYDDYNDLRLDPIGLATYGRWFSFEDRRYEFVLFGDSHAANWKMGGSDVLNLGISGQTSSQIVLRSHILKDKLRGQTLVVIVGANDILSLLTNKKQEKEIIARCLENIGHIIDNHESNFDRVFVMTVPPFFKFPRKYLLYYDKSHRESMKRLNAGVYDVCKNHSRAVVLDAYQILGERAKKESVTTDGLHMNSQGYHYLDELLAEKMAEKE